LRLRKFRVQAFRCIHDSGDIVVGDLAAFIGRNESGKTTILQALTMLNRDEMISELDLCDEMTERLKSDLRIVEGDFELNHDETEIVKERFPDLHITKLKIFRTNKNPEIQYDFGDNKISKEEDKNLEHWQNSTKQLSDFVESIPNYISKKKGLQNEDLFNSQCKDYFLPRAIFDLATLPPLSIKYRYPDSRWTPALATFSAFPPPFLPLDILERQTLPSFPR